MKYFSKYLSTAVNRDTTHIHTFVHTLPLMINLPFVLVVTATTGSVLASCARCTARPRHHALLMVCNIHALFMSFSVKLPKVIAHVSL